MIYRRDMRRGPRPVHETTAAQSRLIAALHARGCGGDGVYSAAHEAAHGLHLDVEAWRPEDIDDALMRLSVADQMRSECVAHATATLVCVAVGHRPADTETIAFLVHARTPRSGVRWSTGKLERAMIAAGRSPEVAEFARRILAMAEEETQ